MSESDSSNSSCSISHSEDSNESYDDTVGCYECEPEYTEEELRVISEKEICETSCESSEDELDSSRLENLHWCRCRCCVIGLTMTLEECKCCKEFNILSEKLETLKCITDHPDFETLILSPAVLELSFIRHRRYQGNFQDIKEINPKQFRFTAYRQYTAWVHYFESLGKGKRVVIPSCVVKEIRTKFPDPNGHYVGFKEYKD